MLPELLQQAPPDPTVTGGLRVCPGHQLCAGSSGPNGVVRPWEVSVVVSLVQGGCIWIQFGPLAQYWKRGGSQRMSKAETLS